MFATVEIGVTELPTKSAEEEEENNFGSEIIFSKVGAHPFKMSFFGAKNYLGGGGGSKPSKKASQ